MIKINGSYTNATIYLQKENIDEATLSQIETMVNSKAFQNPIAIMPDAHCGKGSCIGFTMSLGNKLDPQVVGVDIGCGMLSFKSNIEFNNLKYIDESIRSIIPMGKNINNQQTLKNVNWEKLNKTLSMLTGDQHDFNIITFESWLDKFNLSSKTRIINSLGSMGGGNHFIEGSIDLNNENWITIHSGSRNLGLQVCKFHTTVANSTIQSKNDFQLKLKQIKKNFPKQEWNNEINKIKNSSQPKTYLEGNELKNYLIDMTIAQHYAEWNRKEMMNRITNFFNLEIKEVIETVHNYINFEDKIIRKGAISSYENQTMIIPLNPKDGILVCEGKSNSAFNYSAPHGAGRLFSRTIARKRITKENCEKEMENIYASIKPLDESNLAYKPSQLIEDGLKPTAKIINRLKPIINIKTEDL